MPILNETFKLPIYKSVIEDEDFIEIKKEVFNYINKYKQDFSLAWFCPTLSSANIHPDNSLQRNSPYLNKVLKSHVDLYIKEWDFKHPNFQLDLTSWVNISSPGAFQESHIHAADLDATMFSGVLYIDVLPNSGDIVFHNPLSSYLSILPISNKFTDSYSISPKNKEIIMFPSNIIHRVNPNRSNQDRISVSWNIKILKYNRQNK
jgi:uncharacterized protein (TIGR02466 family)